MTNFEKGLLATALMLLGVFSFYSIKPNSQTHSTQVDQHYGESDLDYRGEKKDYKNLNKNVKTNKFKFKNKITKNTNRRSQTQRHTGYTSNDSNHLPAAGEAENNLAQAQEGETPEEDEEESEEDEEKEDDETKESTNEAVANSGYDSKDPKDLSDANHEEFLFDDTKSITTSGTASFSSLLEDNNEDSANETNSPSINTRINDTDDSDPTVTPSVLTDLNDLIIESKFEEALVALENTTTVKEKTDSFKLLARFVLTPEINTSAEIESLIQNFYYRGENVVYMTVSMISEDFVFSEKEYTAGLIFKSIAQVPQTATAESFAQVYFNGVRALLPTNQERTDSEELYNLYLNLDFAIENKYNDLAGLEQIARK